MKINLCCSTLAERFSGQGERVEVRISEDEIEFFISIICWCWLNLVVEMVLAKRAILHVTTGLHWRGWFGRKRDSRHSHHNGWDAEEEQVYQVGSLCSHILKQPPCTPKRSASVDFWFSAFKESDQAEEDGTFFKQLGSFLKKQTRYLQVSIIKLNQSMIFLLQDLRLNVTSENLWDALGQGTFSVLVGVLTKYIKSRI